MFGALPPVCVKLDRLDAATLEKHRQKPQSANGQIDIDIDANNVHEFLWSDNDDDGNDDNNKFLRTTRPSNYHSADSDDDDDDEPASQISQIVRQNHQTRKPKPIQSSSSSSDNERESTHRRADEPAETAPVIRDPRIRAMPVRQQQQQQQANATARESAVGMPPPIFQPTPSCIRPEIASREPPPPPPLSQPPDDRPQRQALNKLLGESGGILTVKETLTKFLRHDFWKYKELHAKILQCVSGISRLMKLATLYQHHQLHRLIESDDMAAIRGEFRNNLHMQKYVHPVKISRKRSTYPLDPSFEHDLIVNNVELPVLENCSQAIDYAWQQHYQNFHDNIARQLPKHVRNFFKMQTDNVDEICSMPNQRAAQISNYSNSIKCMPRRC